MQRIDSYFCLFISANNVRLIRLNKLFIYLFTHRTCRVSSYFLFLPAVQRAKNKRKNDPGVSHTLRERARENLGRISFIRGWSDDRRTSAFSRNLDYYSRTPTSSLFLSFSLLSFFILLPHSPRFSIYFLFSRSRLICPLRLLTRGLAERDARWKKKEQREGSRTRKDKRSLESLNFGMRSIGSRRQLLTCAQVRRRAWPTPLVCAFVPTLLPPSPSILLSDFSFFCFSFFLTILFVRLSGPAKSRIHPWV